METIENVLQNTNDIEKMKEMYTYARTEPISSVEKPLIRPIQEKTKNEERGEVNGQIQAKNKGKEPVMENFHTLGNLGNILSWGDQQFLELVNEVVEVQAISYDRKRKMVVKRISKKRRLTLDNDVVVTMKENLFDTKKAKVNKLLGEWMAIIDAPLTE